MAPSGDPSFRELVTEVRLVSLQPLPTAEMDRSGDQVYVGVMAMVKQVVQLKNSVGALPASEYPNSVKVGPSVGGGGGTRHRGNRF